MVEDRAPILPNSRSTVYKVTVAYCGGPFSGWQSQKDGSGVQDCIIKALKTLLRHPVKLVGASRTDAGVHALRQIATFRSGEPFERLRWAAQFAGSVASIHRGAGY